MVVNLGNILQRITNYQLKATMHRVLDIGVERFSCPFLATPRYLAEIPSNLLKPTEEQDSSPQLCGEWIIIDRFTGANEWNGFKLPDRSNRYRNKAGKICYRAKKASKGSESSDSAEKTAASAKTSPKRTPKKIQKKPKTSSKIKAGKRAVKVSKK